jgi:hypothetical protein
MSIKIIIITAAAVKEFFYDYPSTMTREFSTINPATEDNDTD